jgi:hypothetical protein
MTETKKTAPLYFRTTLADGLHDDCVSVLCIAYYQQMSRSVISQNRSRCRCCGRSRRRIRQINTGVSGTAHHYGSNNYFCALAVANTVISGLSNPTAEFTTIPKFRRTKKQ